jgi:hypothetical protein
VSANSMPHSKTTCDTFRVADCIAIGTGLDREEFVGDFEKPRWQPSRSTLNNSALPPRPKGRGFRRGARR